MQTGNKRK